MIIIHGLYGSSDNWLSAAKKFESHFELFILDLRNHGNSPHSPMHSYEAMALDVKEFIDDHKISKPIVMGHSMGGKVAMHLGLMYPEIASKMIVVDISPLGGDKGNHRQHRLDHTNIISALRGLPIHLTSSRKEIDALLSERVPSERVRSFLLKNLGRHGDEFYWKLNLDVLAQQVDSIMDGFDLNDPKTVGQKAFPILFVKGGMSDYILEEDCAAIEQFYHEATLVTIPGAGHWVHAEKLDELAEEVLRFTES